MTSLDDKPRPDGIGRPGTVTTGSGRETLVLDAVVTLVDSLLADFDVIDLLTELTERCTDLLDAGSAGLLLVGPDRNLHLMAATSSRTRDIELFQLQAREGPCLECYRTGEPVSVADLRAAAQRWPDFVATAVDAGFRSVHALPMRAAGSVLGALGLFGTSTGQLAPADLAVAQTLAHVATVAILQEHAPTPGNLLPRLSSALTRQIVVEQAKGLVHDQLGLPIDRALTVLRAYARTHGEHLSDVCRVLMSDRAGRAALLAGLHEVDSSLAVSGTGRDQESKSTVTASDTGRA